MYAHQKRELDLYSFLKMGYFFNVYVGDDMETVKKNMGEPEAESEDKKFGFSLWLYNDVIYHIYFSKERIIDEIQVCFPVGFVLPVKVKSWRGEEISYVSCEMLIGQMIKILEHKKIGWEVGERNDQILILKTEGFVNILFDLDCDKLIKMTKMVNK